MFRELFPEKEFIYCPKLKYSGRFSDYNANIRLYKNNLTISLSRKWKGINNEITKGMIQSLLAKMFSKNKKTSTMNIDLYNNFIRSLHLAIPKTDIDEELRRSFDRVNERFFCSQLEISNLIWGEFSKRKFATYDFQTDTIRFSKILKDQNTELIDYVMYHEMLHKKLKFKSNNIRNSFHNTQFRTAEKQFPNNKELEHQLKLLAMRSKRRRSFWNLFT